MALPDGFAVERLAISMAAACGLVWTNLDMDEATRFRICANAALLHPLAEGVATLVLADGLNEAAEAAWAAGRALDHLKGDERLIQRLHRAAAGVQHAGRVLGVLAPVEDVGDVV